MGNENQVGALMSEMVEKFDVLNEAVQNLVSAVDRLERRVDKHPTAIDKVDLDQHPNKQTYTG